MLDIIQLDPECIFTLSGKVMFCKNLTDNQKLIYSFIRSFKTTDGFCDLTNKELGEIFDCAHEHISRAISKFKDLGLIEVELIKARSSNNIIQRKIFIIE